MQRMNYRSTAGNGGIILKKKVICIIMSIMLLVTTGFIIATNVIYGKYLKPTELTMEESYEAKGYSIKFVDYEIYDENHLIELFDNPDVAKKRAGILEGLCCVVLVHATIKVTDVDAMSAEWYTEYMLAADNTWCNPMEMFLEGVSEKMKHSKKQYENGKEYEVYLQFPVNKPQVYEKDLDDIQNWKFLMVWSQNPIVYTKLY